MSSEDRQCLLDEPMSGCGNGGIESLVCAGSVPTVPSNGSQVRFSAPPPRFAGRFGAHRGRGRYEIHADMVYGDGNIFMVASDADKRTGCCRGWMWLRALLAISTLALIVVLLLAVCGVLPIGLGTHPDVIVPLPAPAPATSNAMQQQKQQQQRQSQPVTRRAEPQWALVDPNPHKGAKRPSASDDQLEAAKQLVNNVIDQTGKVLNSAGLPSDASDAVNTALNGVKQLVNAATGAAKSGAPADDVVKNVETQLAEQAMINAAVNALGDQSNGRKGNEGNDVNTMLNLLNGGAADPDGAALVGHKPHNAGRLLVGGPGAPTVEPPVLQQVPEAASPPVTDDDVKQILENTFAVQKALRKP